MRVAGKYLSWNGMWISVFGVPFTGRKRLSRNEVGVTSDNVCSAVWLAGRTGWSRTFISAVSFLYSICFYLCDQSYRQSMKIWKNKGMITGSVSRYFLQVILSGIFLSAWYADRYIVIRSCWKCWKKFGIF